MLTVYQHTFPEGLWNFDDAFSRELLQVWKDKAWKGEIIVDWDANHTYGYLLLQKADVDIPTIRGFFVDKQYRGEGHGKNLLEYCINCHPEMLVNITHGSEKIYLAHNFSILGERCDFDNHSLAYRGPESIENMKAKYASKLK